MFRYQSNKKAFVIAALAILLCLACLTGATLALFTSDPEDGTIGIVATTGNVKVDIVDAANTDHSLVGETLQFHTTKEHQKILFEPGAAYRTQGFRIKNQGSVPIVFRISVNTDKAPDEVDPKYKPMTLDEFLESFDAYIVTESQLNDPETWVSMQNFTSKGSPLPGGETSDVYYLVVKMKEEANDKFQDRSYSGIGVTVTATQGNANIEELN